jgi:hypothetical protein
MKKPRKQDNYFWIMGNLIQRAEDFKTVPEEKRSI